VNGVGFEGDSVWVANPFFNQVTKIRASDGAVLGTVAVGDYPWAFAFDGTHMWVANAESNTVSKR